MEKSNATKKFITKRASLPDYNNIKELIFDDPIAIIRVKIQNSSEIVNEQRTKNIKDTPSNLEEKVLCLGLK